MRAYRLDALNSLDDLVLHEEAAPVPQRGELLIKVRCVSLNYRDVAVLNPWYPNKIRPGLVPCSDAAGEVVAVGEGVFSFAPGDRVLSTFHPRWTGGVLPTDYGHDVYGSGQDGWLTEYKAVSQDAVVRIPDGISDETAASLPCAALTAWNALNGPNPVRVGRTVLTLGSGGVSVFALQLAKALGARVIATTSSAERAARLQDLGADEVINYRETPEWGALARALNDGRGVDRVVEVGGPSTIAQSLRAVRHDGEVVLIGYLDINGPPIDFFQLKMTNATLRSISVGDRAMLADLLDVVQATKLRPVVEQVYDFEESRAAFGMLLGGKQFGKILIRV